MHATKTSSYSRRRFLGTVSGLVSGLISLGTGTIMASENEFRQFLNTVESDALMQSTPEKKSAWLKRRQKDRYLLVSKENSQPMLQLNETGELVWELLDGNKTPLQISQYVCRYYQVDPHQAYVDCLCFIALLMRKGLIQA